MLSLLLEAQPPANKRENMAMQQRRIIEQVLRFKLIIWFSVFFNVGDVPVRKALPKNMITNK
jgi:hypothetical protein